MNANILINFDLLCGTDDLKTQLKRFDELTESLAAKGITVGKTATVSTSGLRDGKYAVHYRKLAGKNFRTPKGQNREEVAKRLLEAVYGAESVLDAEAEAFTENVESESSSDESLEFGAHGQAEGGDDDDVV